MAGVEIQWLGQKEQEMEGENQNVNVNTGANNEPAGTNTQQNQNVNQNDDKGAKNLSNFDEFLKDSKNQAEFDRRVQKAIETAKKNAENLNADVSFLVGDMCEPLIEQNLKVDILVSNPPYIPTHEEVEHSVKDYEPHVALFGGEDGLKFYRVIFERSQLLLKEKSMLAFEMGYNQKENLTALARQYFPNSRIEVIKDMSGKDRMLFIFNNLGE